MLKLFHIFQTTNFEKDRGFTLMETLISIFIGIIILISFYSIVNFTIYTLKTGEINDNINLNGRFIIDYIKREIRSSEYIMSIDNFTLANQELNNNIGFVMIKPSTNSNLRYNFSTFYIKNGSLYRIAYNTNTFSLRRISSGTWGINNVAEEVMDFGTSHVNFENKIITISIRMINNKEYKNQVYILCPLYN